MASVLVVDDAPGFAAVRRVLHPQGFDLCRTEGFARACTWCSDTRFDLGLIDFRLGTGAGGHTGLDLLRRISPQFPAIVLSDTAHATQLEEAVRLGAHDYVFKPITEERLLPVVQSTLAPAPAPPALQRLVGGSPVMRRLRARIEAVAARDVRVLLVGPSGSGKELVARAIHELSPRRPAPFIGVNCAALPRDLLESELFGYERGAFTGAAQRRRGLFELADHGTIFLDEIEELAPEAQAKLLRVLEDLRFRRVGGEEEVTVDVRVLTASNQDLRRRVAAGQFREDLFHRLDVVAVVVPALSEHVQDLPELVAHFLHEFGADSLRLSDRASAQLRCHPWPGNVRELRNAIERALVFARDGEIAGLDLGNHGESVTPVTTGLSAAVMQLADAFAAAIRAGENPRRLLATVEQSLAETALTLAQGNKTAAARWLEIDRKALERRLGHPDRPPPLTPPRGIKHRASELR